MGLLPWRAMVLGLLIGGEHAASKSDEAVFWIFESGWDVVSFVHQSFEFRMETVPDLKKKDVHFRSPASMRKIDWLPHRASGRCQIVYLKLALIKLDHAEVTGIAVRSNIDTD